MRRKPVAALLRHQDLNLANRCREVDLALDAADRLVDFFLLAGVRHVAKPEHQQQVLVLVAQLAAHLGRIGDAE